MGNFLTHLEIQGFKSFAGRTDFSFDTPIVGIVGPNGSGKSNIIDAIRWVLGEREAKNLRGDLLENLVFAGTSGKGSASLARVTLRLNNHGGILPVDGEEVSVSRRIDRTGTSQFYVNNQEIRLRDLISLLAKARLGSRSFTIIGQGEADVFVRVSPPERREMIEEILGLKEFRLKKRTAERQLEQAGINMEQLEASLVEIEPHLKFLRRQRNKWEKRSEIEEEMKELSRKYFSHHYHKFNEEIKKIREEISFLEKDSLEKEKRVSDLRKELDMESIPKEEEMKEIRKKLENLRSQRLEMEKERARVEAKLEYAEEEEPEEYSSPFLLSEIKSFVDEADSALGSDDSEEARGILKKWLDRFRSFFIGSKKGKKQPRHSAETQEELKKIEEKIGGIDELIKENEKKENEILVSRDEESRRLRNQIDRLEEEKNKQREVEDKIREKEMAKERAEFRLQELGNKWQSFGFGKGELEKIGKPEEQDEDWEGIERKVSRLSSKLASIGEIDESLVEEAKETEERYSSYTRELEDLKKALADLEKMISDLEDRIHNTFEKHFSSINKEFNNYFRLMFGGGKAKLKLVHPERNNEEEKEDKDLSGGVEIGLNLPKKKVNGLDMLSGGEKTLVSIAALFALVSVSPPPFLVLDEVDAALDDENTRRFSELVRDFSGKTQFVIVTHNKITMEVIGTLYGVTMGDDGVSRVLSLKFEDAEEMVSE